MNTRVSRRWRQKPALLKLMTENPLCSCGHASSGHYRMVHYCQHQGCRCTVFRTPICPPIAKPPQEDAMQTIEKTGGAEEREGFEPSGSGAPNPAPRADLPASPSPLPLEFANALPQPAPGVAALVSVSRCACGALRSDHLTNAPIGGYCILRKNDRTSRIPGVLRLQAVKL